MYRVAGHLIGTAVLNKPPLKKNNILTDQLIVLRPFKTEGQSPKTILEGKEREMRSHFTNCVHGVKNGNNRDETEKIMRVPR